MSDDHGFGSDDMGVGVATAMREHAGVHTMWYVDRYDAEQVEWASAKLGGSRARGSRFVEPTLDDIRALGLQSYESSVVDGNLVTNAGWTRLLTLATAGTGNLVSSTTARIGAGNGAGTAAAADTDLSASAGSTNRWFQILSSGPTLATNVLTFVAAFASADGNFAWNEFGIDIGTATVTSGNTVSAVLLNHKTSIAQGTKASGQVWTATATITFT